MMIECICNHTPHVMIVDEIGRKQEVLAAQTANQRGVRLVGYVH